MDGTQGSAACRIAWITLQTRTTAAAAVRVSTLEIGRNRSTFRSS